MRKQTQELRIPGCGKVTVELQENQKVRQNGHDKSASNFVQVLGTNNNWYPATTRADIIELVNKGRVQPS